MSRTIVKGRIDKGSVLPDVPSELIRVALGDLAKAEADDRYAIDMGTWHSVGDDTCEVCLAGAVMAMSLGTDPRIGGGRYPTSFDNKTRDRLMALNCFRLGEVYEGLHEMMGANFDVLATGLPHAFEMPEYENSPGKFKIALEVLAHMLENAGL